MATETLTAERIATMQEATYRVAALHELLDTVLDAAPLTLEGQTMRRQADALLQQLDALNRVIMSGLGDAVEDDLELAQRLEGRVRAAPATLETRQGVAHG